MSARTSPTPASARALWRVRVPASGESLPDSLASYDRERSVWKTSQGSLLEDSTSCSVIWPRSGMTRSGRLYALPMSGRPTDGSECSSWPTPQSADGERATTWIGRREGNNPTLIGAVKVLWPTPTTGDASSAGNRNLPGSKAHAGNSLFDVVTGGQAQRQWPTPAHRDFRHSGSPEGIEKRNEESTRGKALTEVVATGLRDQANLSTSGSLRASSVVLNSEWVTSLMGFPSGWTDLLA